MSLNENGLFSASWTVDHHHTKVTQGAVVGISFAWIIGVIGLYILGLVLIIKCIPKRREESEKSSTETEPKSSSERVSDASSSKPEPKGRRRRKITEMNPTMEELDSGHMPGIQVMQQFNGDHED